MPFRARYLTIASLAVLAASAHAQAPVSMPTDQQISDSYIYLLGRLLVLNQEQADSSRYA